MKREQVQAKVKLYGEKGEIEVMALFDTGAWASVISVDLAEKIGWRELPENQKYEAGTAKKGVKIRIIGEARAIPETLGCKIISTPFEVSPDVEGLIIGRRELDAWDVEFTKEGIRLKSSPVRAEII